MLKEILFVLYAGAIPIVPLLGVQYYKKREDRTKAAVCAALFAVQCLISAGSMILYLR